MLLIAELWILVMRSYSHPDCQYITVHLFQSSVRFLTVQVKQFGHSFPLYAHMIWNGLSNNVCNATSIASFRKKLKAHMLANA